MNEQHRTDRSPHERVEDWGQVPGTVEEAPLERRGGRVIDERGICLGLLIVGCVGLLTSGSAFGPGRGDDWPVWLRAMIITMSGVPLVSAAILWRRRRR